MGPPCSGKSRFVRENKQDGDIIVDLDEICFALGSDVSHGARGVYLSAGIAARNAVIDYIAKKQCSAWIIHTSPNAAQKKWYGSHGAVFHVIDPGQDECMRRAKENMRPNGTDHAIRKWYSKNKKEVTLQENKCSREW